MAATSTGHGHRTNRAYGTTASTQPYRHTATDHTIVHALTAHFHAPGLALLYTTAQSKWLVIPHASGHENFQGIEIGWIESTGVDEPDGIITGRLDTQIQHPIEGNGAIMSHKGGCMTGEAKPDGQLPGLRDKIQELHLDVGWLAQGEVIPIVLILRQKWRRLV